MVKPIVKIALKILAVFIALILLTLLVFFIMRLAVKGAIEEEYSAISMQTVVLYKSYK